MAFNGTMAPWASSFLPDRTVENTYGDVVLIFLSGNGILFAQESNDAWYRATRLDGILESSLSNGSGHTYSTTEAASPLGCVQQYQWCNSEYTIPRGCGPLAAWMDALAGAYPLFNLTAEDYFVGVRRLPSITERGSRIAWPTQIGDLEKFGIYDVLQSFGAKALASQTLLRSGFQTALSENQWQLDVTNWWNTTLAFHQAIFVHTALGNRSVDGNMQRLVTPPSNDEYRHLCRSQVRSIYADIPVFDA